MIANMKLNRLYQHGYEAGRYLSPVAVVPLPHDAHGGLEVLIEHAQVAVGLDQAPHLRLGEADHLVEVRVQAVVRQHGR